MENIKEYVDKTPKICVRRCPVCSKVFMTEGTNWGYTLRKNEKSKVVMYCSYHCMRIIEKPRIEKIRIKYDKLLVRAFT